MIEVYVKQFFSIKCSKGDKIVYNENHKCVSNECQLCQFFCGFFSNIISEFQIPSISQIISKVTDIIDPVLTAINISESCKY